MTEQDEEEYAEAEALKEELDATALAELEKMRRKQCPACGGIGWIEASYDPPPPGFTLGDGWTTDVEPCPKCNPDGEKGEEG